MSKLDDILALPVSEAIPAILEMIGFTAIYKGKEVSTLTKRDIEIVIENEDIYIRQANAFKANFELKGLDNFDVMMALMAIRVLTREDIDLGRLKNGTWMPGGNTAVFTSKPILN